MIRYLGVILFLFSSLSVGAQKKPTSSIRFSTTENDPISVILNDRDFNRIGRSLLFKDLPRKRHQVQIYQISSNPNNGRNRGTPIYSGTIKLEPGKMYDAVYDRKSRNLRVFTVKAYPEKDLPRPRNSNDHLTVEKSSDGIADVKVAALDNSDIIIPVNFESNLSTAYQNLKKSMDKETLDKGKLKVVDEFLVKQSVSAYEARAILSWLLFEDNKVLLANQLKGQVTDKQNLDLLADAFSFEKSKTQFLNSLK